jgi:hypothetical protein
MARRSLLSYLPGHEGEVQQALVNADYNFTELYRAAVGVPQGRLTLAANTPVMTASVSGATTVRYTPYCGQSIPIFDGSSSFSMMDFGGELSQLTTDTTKSPAAVAANGLYDMFVWMDVDGTMRCTRGPAWTSASVRSAGTALQRINGILVNAVAITNGPGQYQGTYVGTIAALGGGPTISFQYGTPASGGGQALLNVWNMYNRITVQTRVTDTIAPYAYTTATVRTAGGSSSNLIRYLIGVAEDAPMFYYQQNVTTAAAAGATCQISIGDDSTTAFELGGTYFAAQAIIAATGTLDVAYGKGSNEVLLGQHVAYALELGDGVNANTFNVGSAGSLAGILRM